MGAEFYHAHEDVKALFDMAAEIARMDIAKLCFRGAMDELTQTVNLQPAITVVNLAVFNAVTRAGVQCDVTGGHSLGEYSALCASGFISAEDALRLVLRRGELMHRESRRHPGVMHAIVGLPIEAVTRLVEEESKEGVVSVANHNTAGQIVITGAPQPVQNISFKAESQGARAIPLKVSGAWHSALMRGAEKEFKAFLDAHFFHDPQIPIVHNVTAALSNHAPTTQQIMARQLCSPVRWYDAMRCLMAEGVKIYVEVGPGKVLAGLLKKIVTPDVPAKIYNVNNPKTLERFIHDMT